MKPLTIAIAVLVLVTGTWWLVGRVPVFLVVAEQEYEVGYTLDFWGPDIRNGTYKITKCEPDPEGFRLYGYRMSKLMWLENCIVRPSINGEGFTVSYYEDGQRHYLWAPYDPRELR